MGSFCCAGEKEEAGIHLAGEEEQEKSGGGGGVVCQPSQRRTQFALTSFLGEWLLAAPSTMIRAALYGGATSAVCIGLVLAGVSYRIGNHTQSN